MEEADLGLNRAELQLLMQEADEDNDGTISYEEFMPHRYRSRGILQSEESRQSEHPRQSLESWTPP